MTPRGKRGEPRGEEGTGRGVKLDRTEVPGATDCDRGWEEGETRVHEHDAISRRHGDEGVGPAASGKGDAGEEERGGEEKESRRRSLPLEEWPGRGSEPPQWDRWQWGSAKFLVHVFTRLRRRWQIGRGMPRPVPAVWRPVPVTACRYGLDLATDEEFAAQCRRAERAQGWDARCVTLLKRLSSGATPVVLDLFCCAGGVSEGFRRAGASSVGVDKDEQPSWVQRFGEENFFKGDALDRGLVQRLVRKHRPIAMWASPPCEASSSATFGGVDSKAPRLISATRDLLLELGLPFIIENVGGASQEMPDATRLVGQDFGLRTERPRLFEAGGGLEIGRCPWLAEGGEALRRRSCLGMRARFDRLDRFGLGLRVRSPCCRGNIVPIMGTSPLRCTFEESAEAMGIEVGHMPCDRLAKAISPAYAQHLLGCVARHALKVKFGLCVPSYAESQEIGPRAEREMKHRLRGAGGVSESQGLEFIAKSLGAMKVEGGEEERGRGIPREAEEGEVETDDEGHALSLTELAVRELDATVGGGWSAAWAPVEVLGMLRRLRMTLKLASDAGGADVSGHNVLVMRYGGHGEGARGGDVGRPLESSAGGVQSGGRAAVVRLAEAPRPGVYGARAWGGVERGWHQECISR